MQRITRVKTKELLIWVTLSDMFIDGDDPSRITFKTPTGLGRTYPVSAFAKEGAADAAAKPKDAPATAATTIGEATTSSGAFTCGMCVYSPCRSSYNCL